MNILFVCSGNISRSFLAQMLLQNEVKRYSGLDISVSSAGLFTFPGNPADPEMVRFLVRAGIPVKDHVPRQIVKEDVDWAHLILVMERIHATGIINTWPEAKGKLELLGKYLSGARDPDDIVDPYGKSPYHYRLAQSQITLAIRSLVEKLASSRTGGKDAKAQIHRR